MRLIPILALVLWPATVAAQIPDSFTNLRVLPQDIPRDSLIDIMRRFSLSLGVRCQYCHVGGDGISFEGVEFSSDDDPDKVKARFMLQMVQRLNDSILPHLPERDDPPVTIECKTCHRGLSRPLLLTQELRLTLDRAGRDSAVAEYRDLRERTTLSGRFDFREWEMNLFAERLEAEGRLEDAIAMYRLNEEYYPESASIKFALGKLYEATGDNPAAIAAYEAALAINPRSRDIRARLDALRRRGPP